MRQTTPESLIAALDALPTLPNLRETLAQALSNPYSSFGALTDIIGLDVVMAARLIGAANRPQAGTPRRNITSINKALRILGFDAVRALLASQPVISEPTTEPAGSSSFVVRDLWLHSVAAAVAARAIAVQMAYPEPDEYYLAGLLHDIGKIAMLRIRPNQFHALAVQAAASQRTFYQCEMDNGQPSHAVLGRILLRQWSLPSALGEVAGRHHTPQSDSAAPRLLATAHIADILARALGVGSGGDPFVPPLKPVASVQVALRPSNVETLLTEIDCELSRVMAALAPS
ncbi:MAG TPA: HDOD domain-containing protein [Chloroflexota bacterium]|nr:HDOD domain-containing protein [Chloroflexota bacterium]